MELGEITYVKELSPCPYQIYHMFGMKHFPFQRLQIAMCRWRYVFRHGMMLQALQVAHQCPRYRQCHPSHQARMLMSDRVGSICAALVGMSSWFHGLLHSFEPPQPFPRYLRRYCNFQYRGKCLAGELQCEKQEATRQNRLIVLMVIGIDGVNLYMSNICDQFDTPVLLLPGPSQRFLAQGLRRGKAADWCATTLARAEMVIITEDIWKAWTTYLCIAWLFLPDSRSQHEDT